MKNERKFIIKALPVDTMNVTAYIKETYKTFIGYFFQLSHKKEKAKTWKYKKNCEKIIEKLIKELDPTKTKIINKYNFEIEEITDKKILRKIKLKTLKK